MNRRRTAMVSETLEKETSQREQKGVAAKKAPDDGLLVRQVRAFLAAAEDVDIDVEAAEDLMQAIATEDEHGKYEHSLNENAVHGEDSDSETDDDSVLYGSDEVQDVLTFDEVKEMKRHLKERGTSAWLREYVLVQKKPIPELLRAFGIKLCQELQNKKPATLLYFLKVALSRELRFRERLTKYNTIADAAHLIRSSRRILVLTGAGISVSCGIPDFRSRDGLYAQLKERGEYDLDDPQQMFDITYFRENPSGIPYPPFRIEPSTYQSQVFYSFAHQIYPSNFIPSPCHRFIKLVEDRKQLLRNYTQNIDTLETVAGVKRVLQCHGSFTTATCLQCRQKVTVSGSQVEADIFRQKVSLCRVCNPTTSAAKRKTKRGKKKAKGEWDSNDEDESDGPLYPAGIMKPDITFFGEKLSDEFDKALEEDSEKVDLLLVIGTSLKVSPVAEMLSHLPHSVPQILINKTPIRHINPDIMLLGNADDIVRYLCTELQWELPPAHPHLNNGREHLRRTNSADTPAPLPSPPERVGNSHVWLFSGAEGGKWLQDFRREIVSQVATPSPSGSSSSTRQPTPSASGRKRDSPDPPDERAKKRAKPDQNHLRK